MAALLSVEVRNAIVAVVVASVFVYHVIFKLLRDAVWEPLRLRRIMAKQGVSGPPFKFLLGQYLDMVKFSESFPDALSMDDLANFSPTVTPQYAMYFPKYGKRFLYWWGTMTKLVVRDPEIVKELLIANHESLTTVDFEEKLISQFAGKGLPHQKGEKWTSERRTLNPFFHQDTIKAMVEAMVQGSAVEIQDWEQKVADGRGQVEIDVEPGLHKISGRIISRAAFGEDFEKGEKIFQLQTLLAEELIKGYHSAAYWLIPGFRYLPTERNRLMDLYGSQVDALLHGTMSGRREAVRKGATGSYGDDLLGRMLAAAAEGWDENSQEFNLASVFNNCKLFYFAGQDTVANLLTFTLLMLAVHPEWQERARAEVLESLGDEQSWTASAVSRLKVVGMVQNETLRLFPPITIFSRVARKDIQLKGLFVPKGLTIEFPLAAIHHDEEYWGADVGEFNPGRFANGVSEACTHRQAFFPFGMGPKYCIGSNFAAMEFKIVLAMVLRRFQLVPSPLYKHHPTCVILQRPKFGMPIILKAL